MYRRAYSYSIIHYVKVCACVQIPHPPMMPVKLSNNDVGEDDNDTDHVRCSCGKPCGTDGLMITYDGHSEN